MEDIYLLQFSISQIYTVGTRQTGLIYTMICSCTSFCNVVWGCSAHYVLNL